MLDLLVVEAWFAKTELTFATRTTTMTWMTLKPSKALHSDYCTNTALWISNTVRVMVCKKLTSISFFAHLFLFFSMLFFYFCVYTNMKLHFNVPDHGKHTDSVCVGARQDKGTTCYCWRTKADRRLTRFLQ